MDDFWNQTCRDCREALDWMDANFTVPVGVWLAAHTALLLRLQDAQRRVAQDCKGWF